ncbi:hypothetical protein DFS34DRAFT_614656 [Phlyctochytrium arcticum]|nr:hypothetical protein DFS34DRAFT_614656 [Phlyctochytrium arcticum]
MLPTSAASRVLVRATRNVVASKTPVRFGGGGHGPRGYEPGGYFLGQPRGSKRAFYWWEPLWYFGYYGMLVSFGVAYAFSPRQSPMEAATVEAHRRLAERGETFGWPFPADYGLVKDSSK